MSGSGSNFYGKKLKRRLSIIYRDTNEVPHRKGVNSMAIDSERKWSNNMQRSLNAKL
jgi:hypothetical protein